MKANTTSASVINGGCQQMIQVHQHGGHHNQVGKRPISAKEKPNDDGRDYKVRKDMDME